MGSSAGDIVKTEVGGVCSVVRAKLGNHRRSRVELFQEAVRGLSCGAGDDPITAVKGLHLEEDCGRRIQG